MGCPQNHKLKIKVGSLTNFRKAGHQPQLADEPLDFTKLSMLMIMRVIYKHVSQGLPRRACPGTPCVLPTCSRASRAPRLLSLKGLPSMGSVTRTISSFQPYVLSSPPVKGPLQKASFEMRIQVDREGQESSHTCSNDRQVFRLCLLHAASRKGCCGCEPPRPPPAHENSGAEISARWSP